MRYILSLDQGTTGTRAILYDEQLHYVAGNYLEHRQFYPHPGWCEQDADEIFRNVQQGIALTLAQAYDRGISRKDICCLGLANQGETSLAWSRETGEPYGRAIVWHCQRTNGLAELSRKDRAFDAYVKRETGLSISSYFSALKFRWMLDHIPQVQEAARRGDLCLGTLDTWLIWKLTGGRAFMTDCATASRTMLFNLKTFDWDDHILTHLHIPRASLPDIRSNSGYFGETDPAVTSGVAVPITGSIVDQQGALFGQGCFKRGELKVTYGTGCFLLLNTGDQPLQGKNGLLTTVAWQVGGQRCFALDGGVYIAGAALQWLKTALGFFQSYSEIDRFVTEAGSGADVYFVPAFAGLSVPRYDPTARGIIIGLTTGTQKSHIIRAAVEAICYQIREIMDVIKSTLDEEFLIRIDGGITKCEFLRQFQADILQQPVHVMEDCEATARGTAMLAGLGYGIWKDIYDLEELRSPSKQYRPLMAPDVVDKQLRKWKDAVTRCQYWSEI